MPPKKKKKTKQHAGFYDVLNTDVENAEEDELVAVTVQAQQTTTTTTTMTMTTGTRKSKKRRRRQQQLDAAAAGDGEPSMAFKDGQLGAPDASATQHGVSGAPPYEMPLVNAAALIEWTLGDGAALPWAVVHRTPLLARVVVVVVEGGLDAAHYDALADAETAPFLSQCKHTRLVASLDNAALLGAIRALDAASLASPLAPLLLRRRRQQKKQKIQAQPQPQATAPIRASSLCAAVADLVTHQFPLPDAVARAHSLVDASTHTAAYVDTRPYDAAFHAVNPVTAAASGAAHRQDESDQLFALDCEMVETAAGTELARVALVDGDGRLLFDEFVRTEHAVTDYKTQWSGVTAEALGAARWSLADARREVMRYVHADALLVGHSLENDLMVLRMRHAHIVDTSLLFPRTASSSSSAASSSVAAAVERVRAAEASGSAPPRYFKNKLKYLAQRFLGRAIQVAGRPHAPTEDACAALDLVRHCLRGGRTTIASGQSSTTTAASLAATHARLLDAAAFCAHAGAAADRSALGLTEATRHAAPLDALVDALRAETTDTATTADQKKLCVAVAPAMHGVNALYDAARVRQRFRDAMTTRGSGASSVGDVVRGVFACDATAAVGASLRALDDAIGRVWAAAPARSLLLVVGVGGVTRVGDALAELRDDMLANSAGQWTTDWEQAFIYALRRALTSTIHFAIKS